MTQKIKATVAERAQETNYITLDAEATKQEPAWRMKLIAPTTQWNLDTADRALANNNYRRAEHWKYSTADQTWSATVEKVGRQNLPPGRDVPAPDRSAPEAAPDRSRVPTTALSAAVQGHPYSLKQMLAGSAKRGGAVESAPRPAEHERGTDRGSSLNL